MGITPSFRQARLAYAAHAEWCRQNEGSESAPQHGITCDRSLRENLIEMLDELGVGAHLGLGSAAELFGEAGHLLHTTSALRYPVFKSGRHYVGQSPRPTQHAFLRTMLERLCARELAEVPKTLIVPLGKAVEESLEYLTRLGKLERERWLAGFPHPLGVPAHRRSELSRARAGLTRQIESWFQHHDAASERRFAPPASSPEVEARASA